VPSIPQDLRFAFRQLRQAPAFTTVAVLSLALGVGANTAIFQLIDAIRLRTLPVENPGELAYIDYAPQSARAGWWSTRSARLTSAGFAEVQAQQKVFSGVFAWSAARFNLSEGGEARYAEGLYVSGNFFPVLGVKPVRGRLLAPEDDSPGCGSPAAVLSHAFWQREFGGEASAVGRMISLDGHKLPVVGVSAPAFFGVEVGNRYDVAIPLCTDRAWAQGTPGQDGRSRADLRAAWWLSVMGRLLPGMTVAQADAQLKAASPAFMRSTLPESYKADLSKRYLANKLEVTAGDTGVSRLRRNSERPLWILMAITGLVLLIACANLANLLLARASVREREIAVRQAMGATRWTLVRQLMTESLLLALAGTALGAGLSQVLSRALVAYFDSPRNPRFLETPFDWRILAFMTALALLTCVLFGLLPALRAAFLAPAAAMRSSGRGNTSGRERLGARRVLVSVQVALSLVLVVGALLFVRSLQKLLATDPGFRLEGVLAVQVDFAPLRYAEERRAGFAREINDRLSTLPGVISAAQVMMTPVGGGGWDNSVGPDGAVAAASGKNAWFNRTGPGYFQTMGIGLLAGRDFNHNDVAGSPKVAIVNEAFATKYFGGANPVGRTFHLEAEAGKPEPLMQIVGLVRNTKYYNLREEFRPQGFFPMTQNDRASQETNVMVRVAGQRPEELTRAVKAALAEMNPLIRVEFRPMMTQLEDSMTTERLMAGLSGGFGVLAGLLAALGLYGVISYMVTRRRGEIGLRMALGAGREQVLRLVMKEVVLLLAIGVAAGLVLSVWAGQAAAAMLYELKPYDPMSLAAGVVALVLVALVATAAPVRRALGVDPMVALRDE